jgi:hypothetical protein
MHTTFDPLQEIHGMNMPWERTATSDSLTVKEVTNFVREPKQ